MMSAFKGHVESINVNLVCVCVCVCVCRYVCLALAKMSASKGGLNILITEVAI